MSIVSVLAGAQKGLEMAAPWVSTALNLRESRLNRQDRHNAHQIEMADMLKAGLNPILAGGGSGAAAPTGVPNLDVNPRFSETSAQTASAKEQVRLTKAQADNVEVDTNKKINDSDLSDAQSKLIDVQREIQQKELEKKDLTLFKNISLLDQQIESQISQQKLNSALASKALAEKEGVLSDNVERALDAWLYQGDKGKWIKGAEKGTEILNSLLGRFLGRRKTTINNFRWR